MVDGNVEFATYFVAADLSIEIKDRDKRNSFEAFQTEVDGIVCYSEEEKVQAEALLTSMEIAFTTEILSFLQKQKDKVAGLKYNSRTEAIKHLSGEIEEPESEVIPRLKREKADLQTRVNQAEAALLMVMCDKPNQTGNAFLQRKYSEGNIGDADLQVAVTKGFISVADVSKISGIISTKLL